MIATTYTPAVGDVFRHSWGLALAASIMWATALPVTVSALTDTAPVAPAPVSGYLWCDGPAPTWAGLSCRWVQPGTDIGFGA